MILVVGASGNTGGEVVRALLEARAPVRTLSRRGVSAPGVDSVVGDVRDPEVLSRALAGVERVFLATSNGPDQESAELAVVAAARRAAVRYVVKLSAPIVGDPPPVAIARTHLTVERALAAAGLPHANLRPYSFMQNLRFHVEPVARFGAMFGMTGDAQLNWIDARDVGRVGAALLLQPRPRVGPLVLTGARTWSMPEVAALLSARVGAAVVFVAQREGDFRRGLRRAGCAPWLVEHLVEIQAMARAFPERPTDTVASILGRAPGALERFLADEAAAFAPRAKLAERALGWWLRRGRWRGVPAVNVSAEPAGARSPHTP
jgi:uncharacterized protein YbjT (DUF2867 family)